MLVSYYYYTFVDLKVLEKTIVHFWKTIKIFKGCVHLRLTVRWTICFERGARLQHGRDDDRDQLQQQGWHHARRRWYIRKMALMHSHKQALSTMVTLHLWTQHWHLWAESGSTDHQRQKRLLIYMFMCSLVSLSLHSCHFILTELFRSWTSWVTIRSPHLWRLWKVSWIKGKIRTCYIKLININIIYGSF